MTGSRQSTGLRLPREEMPAAAMPNFSQARIHTVLCTITVGAKTLNGSRSANKASSPGK